MFIERLQKLKEFHLKIRFIYGLKAFTFVFFFLFHQSLLSQNFGGEPPSTKFYITSYPHASYVHELEDTFKINRSYQLINSQLDKGFTRVGSMKRSLPIIFRNKGVNANGFVAVGPFRSEFFTTRPVPFDENGVWLDLLTQHEYEHVLQFSNAKKNLFNFGYFLGGDNLFGVLSGLTLPNWYFEGGAVEAETMYSQSGRGRSPAFFKLLNGLKNEAKSYPYIKVRNGSYRTPLPSSYDLGYVMMSHGRNMFGDSLWWHVVDDVTKFKGILYPFSSSLKRRTGLSTPKLYKKALEETPIARKLGQSDPSSVISPLSSTNSITRFRLARWIADDEIIALKSNWNQTTRLVQLNRKSQKKLFEPGIMTSDHISATDQYILWTERRKHLRYDNVEYSVAMLYDRKSGVKRQLTKKSRLFYPEIASDNSRYIALEISPHDEKLQIRQISDGAILFDYPSPSNSRYEHPRWSVDLQSIYAWRIQNEQSSLIEINIKNQSEREILPPSPLVFSAVNEKNGWLYFSSTHDFKSDIYGFNFATETVHEIYTSNQFLENPSISPKGDSIVFSAYKTQATHLKKVAVVPRKMIQLEQEPKYPFAKRNYPIQSKFNSSNSFSASRKKYGGLKRYLKLHSWYPNGNIEPNEVGIDLYSNNYLNDTRVAATYRYLFDDAASYFGASAEYGGQFPFLQAGFGSFVNRNWNFLSSIDGAFYSVPLRQSVLTTGLRIPLSNYYGNSIIGGQFSSHYRLNFVDFQVNQVARQYYHVVRNTLELYKNKSTGIRSMNRPFSYSFWINYSIGFQNIGNQVSGRFTTQWPGLFKNHGFTAGIGYLKNNTSRVFRHGRTIAYPRGFSAPYLTDEIFLSTLDYEVPLAYPDFGWSGVFFVQRLRLNAFHDFGGVNLQELSAPFSYDMHSVGLEFIADIKWFYELNIPIGVRYSRLMSNDPYSKNDYRIEFVMPVSLSSLTTSNKWLR